MMEASSMRLQGSDATANVAEIQMLQRGPLHRIASPNTKENSDLAPKKLQRHGIGAIRYCYCRSVMEGEEIGRENGNCEITEQKEEKLGWKTGRRRSRGKRVSRRRSSWFLFFGL